MRLAGIARLTDEEQCVLDLLGETTEERTAA
jgi:hypothetical protein